MNFKIYVITLKRIPERTNAVIRNFKKAGISNYEFVEGLDAMKFTTPQLQRFLDKKNLVQPLTNGMIGCAVGHVRAVRRFLKDDSTERGIILEDDFLIQGDICHVVSSISNEILNQGPVLLYGYVKVPIAFKKSMVLNGSHSLYEVEPPLNIWSSLSYLVNKKSAKNLLMAQYPVKDSPDNWEFFRQFDALKKLHIVYPFLLNHEIFDSTRVLRKQRIADWIIQYRIPVLYDLLKKKRQRFVESDTSLISFDEAL